MSELFGNSTIGNLSWLQQPNPAEFMLKSAQAAEGIGRNFLGGMQLAQRRQEHSDEMAFKYQSHGDDIALKERIHQDSEDRKNKEEAENDARQARIGEFLKGFEGITDPVERRKKFLESQQQFPDIFADPKGAQIINGIVTQWDKQDEIYNKSAEALAKTVEESNAAKLITIGVDPKDARNKGSLNYQSGMARLREQEAGELAAKAGLTSSDIAAFMPAQDPNNPFDNGIPALPDGRLDAGKWNMIINEAKNSRLDQAAQGAVENAPEGSAVNVVATDSSGRKISVVAERPRSKATIDAEQKRLQMIEEKNLRSSALSAVKDYAKAIEGGDERAIGAATSAIEMINEQLESAGIKPIDLGLKASPNGDKPRKRYKPDGSGGFTPVTSF